MCSNPPCRPARLQRQRLHPFGRRSRALHVLRTVEEHLQKHGTHDLIVRVPTATALYILNEKRRTIDELEAHYGLHIMLEAVEGHGHQHIAIEHGAEAVQRPRPQPVRPISLAPDDLIEVMPEEDEIVAEVMDDTEAATETEGSDDDRPRRFASPSSPSSQRAQVRCRGQDNDIESVSDEEDIAADDETTSSEADVEVDGEDAESEAAAGHDEDGKSRKRRRRGRRGGRRTREDEANDAPVMDLAEGAGSNEALPDVVSDDVAEEPVEVDATAPVEIGDVAERSFEPEMTDAVDAMAGVDLDARPLGELEADRNSDVPDENEVMAATAEAGALIDGNPPLDEVFPSDSTPSTEAEDNSAEEASRGHD